MVTTALSGLSGLSGLSRFFRFFRLSGVLLGASFPSGKLCRVVRTKRSNPSIFSLSSQFRTRLSPPSMMTFATRRSVLATVCASVFLADNATSSDFTTFACVFSNTKALSHSLYN